MFAAILFQAFWLGLPAVFLSIGLVISYSLWIGASWKVAGRLRVAFALAVVVFLGHVTEEFLTGFQTELPALFGRPGWSDARFITFNAVWALVFSAAGLALHPRRTFPVYVVLFFAVVGGVGNGVAHLMLALQRGAYSPGAWTAALCLGIGIWLLGLLYGRARPRRAEDASPSART